MNHYVIKMAQVESVEDDADGLRIKARLSQDGMKTTSELPYSYPLLPKTFRIVPKVGEGVLIFLSELGNNDSNRYYIGPIISQDQKLNFDQYDYGRGTALSLLQGGEIEPLTKLSKYTIVAPALSNLLILCSTKLYISESVKPITPL